MSDSEGEPDIEITDADRAFLREGFDKYTGGNDQLSCKELAKLLHAFKVVKNKGKANRMAKKVMKKFSDDGDRKLDFDEYVEFCGKRVLKAKLIKEDWRTETLRRAFTAADKDESGELSVREIRSLTDPATITIEQEDDDRLDFENSLPYLRSAAETIENSVDDQVSALFRMFGKDFDDNGMDKRDVKRAIPVLRDLLTAFEKVDEANENGGELEDGDDMAPIPKNGELEEADVSDLFTYYHFKRLATEMADS